MSGSLVTKPFASFPGDPIATTDPSLDRLTEEPDKSPEKSPSISPIFVQLPLTF